MINYSIVLRRTDMSDENSPKKAYATAQYSEVMDMDRFCKHIADHGCAYDRADVNAIGTKIVDCLRELLLAGHKVKLGALGSFSVTLQSTGADSADKFTSNNITAVRVQWEPGRDFLDLLLDAEFQQVPTRSIAAAALKAEKQGDGVVDVAKIKEEEAQKRKNGQQTAGPSDSGEEQPDAAPKSKFTLTVTSANEAQGSVTGGGQYEEGAEATLKATAKSGFTFSKWSDGVTTSTRKVTVSGDATYTAEFVEQSNTPPSI